MASFLFFATMTEQAWFLGSAVVVTSLMLHCTAQPYEDKRIDWCEMLSLLSTLFIFQSGIVFKVLNDPSKPETTSMARSMSNALEWSSMALTVLNAFLVTICEIHVWKQVRAGEEDYRVRMLEGQKAELEERLESFAKGIAKAQAHADRFARERSARRAARDEDEAKRSPRSGMVLFEVDNPVSEDNRPNPHPSVLGT